MGGLTSFEGRFLLVNVSPGTHTLTFRHDDLGTWEVEVEVGEAGTTGLGAVSPDRR